MDCSLVSPPKDATAPNFMEKAFTNSYKTLKFVKAFSLKSFLLWLYDWVFNPTIFYTGSIAATGSYTESSKPVYINDLNCTGSEESVWECPRNGIEGYSCNHRQDASVMCQGILGVNCSRKCLFPPFTGIQLLLASFNEIQWHSQDSRWDYMAVVSGRAGRVLARPVFRRLNVHMRTLDTREVIRIRTSKPSCLEKRLAANHCANLTDTMVMLHRIFSHFSLLDGHSLLLQSPYCLWHVCAAKFISGI